MYNRRKDAFTVDAMRMSVEGCLSSFSLFFDDSAVAVASVFLCKRKNR